MRTTMVQSNFVQTAVASERRYSDNGSNDASASTSGVGTAAAISNASAPNQQTRKRQKSLLEIESERLEIERERLALEKERLALEKELHVKQCDKLDWEIYCLKLKARNLGGESHDLTVL